MHHLFFRSLFSLFSGAALTGLLTLGCAPSEEEPMVVLHLFNPFGLEGIPDDASGHTPYFHGAHNGFSLTQMTAEGSCGWFTASVSDPPGDFRFYGSDWKGPQWGQGGLGSEVNFNQDALFATNSDIYAVPDIASGVTSFSSERPFECDASSVVAAENPFSQGAVPSNASPAHVKDLYQIWLDHFYEEEGTQARIRFDIPSETVSEGIGYGMLIFVYADDASAQDKFDKLLAYYQAHLNSSGLMDWKIDGFASASATGAATDADLDVATALILASRKWKQDTYLSAAQAIITSLQTNAFDASGYLKSGDRWQDGEALNPSYFSFVAFQLFSEVDTANATFWQDAITRHYALIQQGSNESTGLIANWTSTTGAPQQPPATTPYPAWADFGFDAIRVPWRAAWAALWYGTLPAHTPAASIAQKICVFASTSTAGDPAALQAEYSLEGSPQGGDAGPGAIGAYASACMLDSSNATYLDASYNLMRTKTASYDVTYYQTSLQVLEALLLSGELRPQ